MGLDMYLCKRKKDGMTEELAYWRKANAIHGWFDRHSVATRGKRIEDGEEYPVTDEMLKDLRRDCIGAFVCWDSSERKFPARTIPVLESIMPPCKGFFFGNYEYDESYKQDLENTIDQIENVLETRAANRDKSPMFYMPDW